MKLLYHDHFSCSCGDIFFLFIPLDIVMFNRPLAYEAARQHELGVLRHTIAHMEGKLNGQIERAKDKSYL